MSAPLLRNRPWAHLVVVVMGLCFVLPSGAAGQGLSRSELEAAIADLDSPQPQAVEGAIQMLALSGGPQAITALSERITAGLPPRLAQLAVESLGIIGRSGASETLVTMTRHRRPEVRVAAVRALGACQGAGCARSDSIQALEGRLGDPDQDVRTNAALALGQLGSTGSVSVLFRALERGILQAATSLGQLARGDEIGRLVSALGRVPFDAMSPAFAELLSRRDVSTETKLSLVARLGELATPGARQFLVSQREALVAEGNRSRPLLEAIDRAIQRISE